MHDLFERGILGHRPYLSGHHIGRPHGESPRPTNINIPKTSVRKLRKVKPSSKKSIAILLVHCTGLLRASRAACAFFVACDTLPIFAGGTRVRRRRLGSA